jgi:hypothetical protein
MEGMANSASQYEQRLEGGSITRQPDGSERDYLMPGNSFRHDVRFGRIAPGPQVNAS